jgi:hypothetical protein
MNRELKQFENSISKFIEQKLTNIIQDQECEEYSGFNFQIDKLNLKFRKAKITPKKVGQFVTLWRRNSDKQTEPFNETDNFDFYIISTEQAEKFGFFIFPKSILIDRQILTTNQKEGKRGFRVYPNWIKTENKQAQKTQTWQTNYFINLTNNEQKNIEKLKTIINL